MRSINDVMEYTKRQNIPGLMTTFDFKKAFDSISWQFLFDTLKVFIRWVVVLYSDISSCVMNNRFASEIVAQNSQSEAANKKIPVGVGVSVLSFLSPDHTK